MNVLGIDPGHSGAFVSYGQPFGSSKVNVEVIEIADFTQKAQFGRGLEIKWHELGMAMWNKWGDYESPIEHVSHVYIERVAAMPNQGASSMFKFGTAFGGVLGLTFEREPVLVQPVTWKKHFGVLGSKTAAYHTACDLFPEWEHLFTTPRGRLKDGIVDALLIAKYGYDMESQND